MSHFVMASQAQLPFSISLIPMPQLLKIAKTSSMQQTSVRNGAIEAIMEVSRKVLLRYMKALLLLENI